MNRIVDLKTVFVSREVYDVYSNCMYMPTWEKFCERANQFIGDELVSIFGFVNEDTLMGVLVVRQDTEQNAEIKGIAVDVSYRHRGIGRKLIDFVFNKIQIKSLLAETDDDAILFYKHCGFEAEEIIKRYQNKECRRYKCILMK